MQVKAKDNKVADAKRTTIYITEKYTEAMAWVDKKKMNTGESASNIILEVVHEHVVDLKKKEASIVLPIKKIEAEKWAFQTIEFRGRELIFLDDIHLPRKSGLMPGYKKKLYENDFFKRKICVYEHISGKLLLYIKNRIVRYPQYDSEYDTGNNDYDEGIVLFEISEYRTIRDLSELMAEFPEIPQEKVDKLILELYPSEKIDDYIS